MRMKVNRIVLSAIIATNLVACSSVESDMKSFIKCGMAANQLERSVAAQNISTKMAQYIRENNVDGSARYAMHLGQEVRDDLALYDKSLEGQIYTLVKVYNSSTCRDMHEQEKVKMPFLYYLAYIFI